MNKILFLVNVDWAFIINRLPIAIAAKEKGYEVHIACHFTGKEKFLESFGFVMHSVSFNRNASNPFKELLTLAKIYMLLREIKPDLIHSITIKPVLYGGLVCRLLPKCAFIAAISGLGIVYSSDVPRNVFLRKMTNIIYRIILKGDAFKVIFQNSSDRKILQDLAGLKDINISQIRGSGADLKIFKLTDEPDGIPVVSMACRLIKEKGIFEFFEAAKFIKSEGFSVKFQVIGSPDPGNSNSITEDEIDMLKKDNVVKFLGHRDDVAEIFSRSTIVAFPSYYGEGLPKVIIEAAACGRPVVTTSNPGCAEAVVEGLTGLIVPPQDSRALAEAILTLLRDKKLRLEMGKNARLFAEKEFDVNSVVSKHLSIYSELLS